MPSLAKSRITAWSYSRLAVYETCPAQAKYKFIDKLPEPGSAAMDRGSDIHKLAENYVSEKLPKLPPELKLFSKEFTSVRKPTIFKGVELEWAFTSGWKPTGWFDRDAWCRVKVDLAVQFKPTVLDVIDHKTGKRGLDDPKGEGVWQQLDLYALAGFCAKPEIEEINTKLWYLDAGKEMVERYTRKDVPRLIKFWDKKSRPMMRDTAFRPTPSHACKWCAYSNAKGGPCEY